MPSDVDASTLTAELRSFICDTFLMDAETGLDETASLLAEGIVDSTGILELVQHVEDSYGFTVRDEDIVPENFDSVHQLCGYVRRRLSE